MRTPFIRSALAELGIAVEQSHGCVPDGVSAVRIVRPRIREIELAILVIGTSGASADIDLIVVVLPRLLVVDAKL